MISIDISSIFVKIKSHTDSNRYFQNHIEVKSDDTRRTSGDYDHLECLYERTSNALQSIDEIILKLRMDKSEELFGYIQSDNHRPAEQMENTSYLDMSRKKYETIDSKTMKNPADNLNRHDYVDVVSKPMDGFIDDDNIYDNYSVERNHETAASERRAPIDNRVGNSTSGKEDVNGGQKLDCPFNGLPAAHLTIMHSPKVGWLSMHLRGKRYIHHFGVHFKRKYYTGMVMKQNENAHCEWWLLMYAGGTNDLKPSVCLPLNRYGVHANLPKSATKRKEGSQRQDNETKFNPCKFELNEKSQRKNRKSYCFVTDTPENCEHWVNLLKQLSIGLPYVESTFQMTAQIRKLPMLPLSAKSIDLDRPGTDTTDLNGLNHSRSNDRNDFSSDDVCNHSEGVYEEPEDYYRNVQNYSTASTKLPILPQKSSSVSPIRTDNVYVAEIYDTPKKPIRKSDESYDRVSVDNNSPTHGRKHLKTFGDEMCTKQSAAKLKDHTQTSGRMASDEDSSASKYHISTVRKWLFSNHFSKLRQSSNSSNSERISSEDGTIEGAVALDLQQQQPQPQPQQSQCNNSTVVVPPTDGQRRTFNVQPTKFNKVHMIINQLEANGQLTLISGGNTATKV